MVKMCGAAKSTSFQIVVAIAVATAVVLTTAAVLIYHFNNKPEKDEFYPDLISVNASSCWEANVFATSKDPYYKWVTGTLIPSLLWGIRRSDLSMAAYAAAYQKMSVWRVSRQDVFDQDPKGTGVLYTAPDPRLMGGLIRKHAKSWIWNMRVHWGISIRKCLNTAVNKHTSAVEACQQTAPIIPILNSTATRPALALLHVQVPFDDSFSSGFYLTNFASSAKSNISLGVGSRQVPANDSANDSTSRNWYYFQDDIKECEPRFPAVYLPDVVSDYVGPQLYQCGCISPAALNLTGGAAACLIGKNLPSIASVLPLGQGCDTALSFWDTYVDLGDGQAMLQTHIYRPLWSSSFVITTRFNNLKVLDAFTSSNIKLVAPGLMTITECVESWLKNFSRAPTREDLNKLPSACHHDMITITKCGMYKASSLQWHLDKIVTGLLDQEQIETELDCGLQSKLDKAPLCYITEDLESEGIHKLLKDVLRLAQVKNYGQKLWEDESQKRSQVYLALLTSVIGLFGTMVGMLSRTISDAENAVLRNAPRYLTSVFVPKSPFHRSLLRTVVRIKILLCSVVALLVGLFFSIKDIKKEREAATSETILHFDKNGAFLVTTTSTLEVEPNWIVYVIFTALVALTLVPFSIVVFFKVSSDEKKVPVRTI